MLYIYKDRRLIFLCMLFFFIQINPNENESSCLISEWNFCEGVVFCYNLVEF